MWEADLGKKIRKCLPESSLRKAFAAGAEVGQGSEKLALWGCPTPLPSHLPSPSLEGLM